MIQMFVLEISYHYRPYRLNSENDCGFQNFNNAHSMTNPHRKLFEFSNFSKNIEIRGEFKITQFMTLNFLHSY